jgi:hypothetical protein
VVMRKGKKMKLYIITQSYDTDITQEQRAENNKLLYKKEAGFTSAEACNKYFYDCYGNIYVIREIEVKKNTSMSQLPEMYGNCALVRTQVAMTGGQKVKFEKKIKLDVCKKETVDYYIKSTTGKDLPGFMKNERTYPYDHMVGIMAYNTVDAAVKEIRSKVGFSYAVYCNYGD